MAAGGEAVGAQPGFARLFARTGPTWTWVCSGAVIRPGWLLTAAHPSVRPDFYSVRRGLASTGGAVSAVYVHPAFSAACYAHDRHPDLCLVRFEDGGGAHLEVAVADGTESIVVAVARLARGPRIQRVAIRPLADCARCRALLMEDIYCGPDVLCGRTEHPTKGSAAQLQGGDSGAPLLSLEGRRMGVAGVLSQSNPARHAALAVRITAAMAAWISRTMEDA